MRQRSHSISVGGARCPACCGAAGGISAVGGASPARCGRGDPCGGLAFTSLMGGYLVYYGLVLSVFAPWGWCLILLVEKCKPPPPQAPLHRQPPWRWRWSGA